MHVGHEIVRTAQHGHAHTARSPHPTSSQLEYNKITPRHADRGARAGSCYRPRSHARVARDREGWIDGMAHG
ncbi:hypothetical protein OAO87_03895 [bacterium]|nr:hypothetical protein [bacterium]